MDSSRIAAAQPWTRSFDVNALHVFSKFSCVSCPHRARSQGTAMAVPVHLLRDGGQRRSFHRAQLENPVRVTVSYLLSITDSVLMLQAGAATCSGCS